MKLLKTRHILPYQISSLRRNQLGYALGPFLSINRVQSYQKLHTRVRLSRILSAVRGIATNGVVIDQFECALWLQTMHFKPFVIEKIAENYVNGSHYGFAVLSLRLDPFVGLLRRRRTNLNPKSVIAMFGQLKSVVTTPTPLI
jgi:hypothetical protein